MLRYENERAVLRIGALAMRGCTVYEAVMKFQCALGPVRFLSMLAAVTLTLPAVAQERAPAPELKSRDAKTTEPAAPAVSLKIEGVRNGLQIRIVPKEEGPAPEDSKGDSCKQDCELKLPAGSYTLIATQVESPQVPGMAPGAPPPPAISETEASRHRLGSALGVGGIVAAAMGSYLAIGALVAYDAESSAGLNEFFYAGLAGIGVGAGLMIGGFSLAAANRATPAAADRMPDPVLRRDVTGTRGVSLSGAF